MSARSQYLTGLLFLGAVNLLWTGASELTQYVFDDDDFVAPFFVTYYTTALFTCNIWIYLSRRMLHRIWCTTQPKNLHMIPSLKEIMSEPTFLNTLNLAKRIAPVWFTMNYFFNMSLIYTSVSSSTIISCTSSLWVAVIEHSYLKRQIAMLSAVGIGISIIGAFLVGWDDETDHSISNRELLGDAMGLVSSVLYALFSIVMDGYDNVPIEEQLSKQEDRLTKRSRRTSHIVTRRGSSSSSSSLTLSKAKTSAAAVASTVVAVASVLVSGETDQARRASPAHTARTAYAGIDDDLEYNRPDTQKSETKTKMVETGPSQSDQDDDDQKKINALLLFGMIGVLCLIYAFPLFLIVNFAGLDPSGLPSGSILLKLTVAGLFGNVMGDYLYVRGLLYTSPIVASVGLTLTVPLAMLADYVIQSKHFDLKYLSGGACFIIGFVVVNLRHHQTVQQATQRDKDNQALIRDYRARYGDKYSDDQRDIKSAATAAASSGRGKHSLSTSSNSSPQKSRTIQDAVLGANFGGLFNDRDNYHHQQRLKQYPNGASSGDNGSDWESDEEDAYLNNKTCNKKYNNNHPHEFQAASYPVALDDLSTNSSKGAVHPNTSGYVSDDELP